MKTEKLNAMEKRALAFCQAIEKNDGGTVIVEWKKSRDYGRCPAVIHQGEKIAYAPGCGYHKLSAAVSDALRFLSPSDTVRTCSGCGIPTLRNRMAVEGWILTHTADGSTFDVFTVTRKG